MVNAKPIMEPRAEDVEWIAEAYSEGFRPSTTESIIEFAAREIELDETSPIPGKYRIANSPQMAEPLVTWQNNKVRHQMTIGPNQGGRTKGMEVACIWSAVNRPGPMQWNTDTNDKAADHGEKRFWPTAEKCAPFLSLMPPSVDRRKRGFVFRNGVPFSLQGANETNLQQDSIHTQFNDEVYKWKPGMLGQAHKRCNVSYAAAHKIWDASIPGEEGSEWHEQWNQSTRGDWSFKCRECGMVQAFKWGGAAEKGGVKWLTTELTKPAGEWNFEEMAKTVYYECANHDCHATYSDTKHSRKVMNDSARYVHAAPGKKVIGHRYNVLSVNFAGVTWAQWAEEFIRANRHYKLYGDPSKLEEFVTRRLAEFWEESRYCSPVDGRLKSDYELGDPNVYILGKWGEDEWGRFMAVDKQESHYYGVIRAVKAGGASRLIWCGKLYSYDEISKKAEDFGVIARRVLIDGKFEMREVFGECVKRGWVALMGSDRENFAHRVELPGGEKQWVKRPYSEPEHGDPAMGKREQQRGRLRRTARGKAVRLAPFFYWSNLTVKNLLNAVKQGRASLYWAVPTDAGTDYIAQLNSEVRYRKLSKGGMPTYYWSNCGRDGKGHKKANHYLDCECMILAAMLIQKLIDLDKWEVERSSVFNQVNDDEDEGEKAA